MQSEERMLVHNLPMEGDLDPKSTNKEEYIIVIVIISVFAAIQLRC